ncbi:MAG: cytochrome c oxidase subunit II [Anaerolineae bacterium]|nr:cytochrome c oxidase subunit II [Anaerolineae bacterium]
MDISKNPSQQSAISTMPLIIFGVLALVFGLGTYVFYPSWGTLPMQASVQAERTDELFRVLIGISAVVFFLVQGLVYYAAVAFRAKANDFTDGPAIHGNVMLEIVWTIVPSVIVVTIALYSFVVWSDNTEVLAADSINVVDGEPLDINVYAQRFGWSFEYITNEENVEGDIIVLNSLDLHTYVGQNLFLRMDTRDVIHSFWVPTMRIKQDLLPGRTTEVRFTTMDPEVGWQFGAALSPVTVYAEARADSEIVFEDLTETDTDLSIYPVNVELELADRDAQLEGNWTAVIINGEDGFVATDEILGRYNKLRVVCAELCGSGHGAMGFTSDLILWESEDAMMDAWYNNAIEANRIPPSGPVDLGRILLSTGSISLLELPYT